ncbi:MAG: efflux RND transporter periplasmic adaptor subunit [Terrimicrobiaceae bacterium]|nr:efflux RND transporter periplasmic adaptor subunit [Terrimicrobiaceae bacterium]
MSRKTKRVILGFTAVGLAVVFITIGSLRYLDTERDRQRFEQERSELKPPAPVPVTIRSEPLKRERRFTAELVPWTDAGVPAEVPGRVIETAVEAGQSVKAGDVLVRLDPVQAQIAVDLARARHAEAIRLLGEAQTLQKNRVVSETALEAAAAEARATKAQLDEAEDRLRRHTITAPFDGVVNERLVDVGDAVNVNQAVVRIVDLQKLRVRLDVTERELTAFPPGTQLPVRVLSGREGPFEATVRFVAGSADPGTRLFRVEAELDNREIGLPGGVQGVVDAVIESYPTGPVVPAAAVRFAGRDAMVLKDEGGQEPVATRIIIGPEIGGVFPVLEGLREGDRVLIR